MAGFRLDFFKGIRPRVSKRKLPIGEAQTAENIKFGEGDLQPWDENSVEQTVTDTFNNRTIFLYDNDGSAVWFEFSNLVDVARGPLKGDPLERVYYTGDGVPKMTYNTLQTSSPYPSLSYDLGIPKPSAPLTGTGVPLPEDLDPDLRRTSTDALERPSTANFEVVFADFIIYPGTGTPNDTWRLNLAAAGDITFRMDVGDTYRVLEVLDSDNVTLGSNIGTGAVAATAANDKTSDNYWHPMDEQGSTQTADFIGWRIPDGMRITVAGHRLRVGDVIRITRNDRSFGLSWSWSLTDDLFELQSDGTAGDWGVPLFDTEAGIYRHENVLLGASDDGQTLFELGGGFYYDVDRASSTNATLEDRTYVYTYVSALGEEGPPSDPSSLVQALDGDTVTLSGFDMNPPGAVNIVAVRIYRTNATAIGTEYQFVRESTLASIGAAGFTATDTIPASGLGELIETTTWFKPDPEMQGIITMPNGMMVGFKAKNIYFSEPFQPHAWPPEYDQAVDYDVVALAPFGNSVAVLTKGTPYIITASHPRNANIRPYKINQACVNKESVATANDKVYYASPDGLVEIGVNGARVITDPYMKKEEWAAYSPATMVADFHDGRYYGFFDGSPNVPQPPASVVATGTIFSSTTEAEIVAGTKTIILTLTSDTWVAAGGTFDGIRQDIIDEIVATGSEQFGWNNERVNIPVTDVSRDSDTVVTITLSALGDYSITVNEFLNFAAPASATVGAVRYVAGQTALISESDTYGAQAIVVSAAADVPAGAAIFLQSVDNIANWPISFTVGILEGLSGSDFTDAAFHQGVGRWAVCGLRPSTSESRLYTSDNLSNTSDWTKRTLFTTANTRPSRALLFEPIVDALFLGGDNGLLQYSLDGINWERGFLPASVDTLSISKFARAPWGSAGAAPSVYAIFSTGLTVAFSANLASQPLNSTWGTTGALAPASGTLLTSITSGNRRIYLSDNSDPAEIGYIDHGDTVYNSIGTIAMDIADMTYGNDRLVAISATGEVSYVDVDADAELTIGNWSSPSAVIRASSDLAKVVYDEGDGAAPGYGFIAVLSDAGAPNGIYIYTSPDAITWTQRATTSGDLDALGLGVAYPESNLDTIP